MNVSILSYILTECNMYCVGGVPVHACLHFLAISIFAYSFEVSVVQSFSQQVFRYPVACMKSFAELNAPELVRLVPQRD